MHTACRPKQAARLVLLQHGFLRIRVWARVCPEWKGDAPQWRAHTYMHRLTHRKLFGQHVAVLDHPGSGQRDMILTSDHEAMGDLTFERPPWLMKLALGALLMTHSQLRLSRGANCSGSQLCCKGSAAVLLPATRARGGVFAAR